jgi:hypothetical protein
MMDGGRRHELASVARPHHRVAPHELETMISIAQRRVWLKPRSKSGTQGTADIGAIRIEFVYHHVVFT